MRNFLFKKTQYFNFLLTSINKHGVHSPFVFDIVTKCFEMNKWNSSSKQSKAEQLLNTIITYFGNTEAIVIKKDINVNAIHEQLNHLKNDSYILISDPYLDKERLEKWKQLIKLEKVTVSIDTFYLGLLFIRNQQLKQHFAIRV